MRRFLPVLLLFSLTSSLLQAGPFIGMVPAKPALAKTVRLRDLGIESWDAQPVASTPNRTVPNN